MGGDARTRTREGAAAGSVDRILGDAQARGAASGRTGGVHGRRTRGLPGTGGV